MRHRWTSIDLVLGMVAGGSSTFGALTADVTLRQMGAWLGWAVIVGYVIAVGGIIHTAVTAPRQRLDLLPPLSADPEPEAASSWPHAPADWSPPTTGGAIAPGGPAWVQADDGLWHPPPRLPALVATTEVPAVISEREAMHLEHPWRHAANQFVVLTGAVALFFACSAFARRSLDQDGSTAARSPSSPGAGVIPPSTVQPDPTPLGGAPWVTWTSTDPSFHADFPDAPIEHQLPGTGCAGPAVNPTWRDQFVEYDLALGAPSAGCSPAQLLQQLQQSPTGATQSNSVVASDGEVIKARFDFVADDGSGAGSALWVLTPTRYYLVSAFGAPGHPVDFDRFVHSMPLP